MLSSMRVGAIYLLLICGLTILHSSQAVKLIRLDNSAYSLSVSCVDGLWCTTVPPQAQTIVYPDQSSNPGGIADIGSNNEREWRTILVNDIFSNPRTGGRQCAGERCPGVVSTRWSWDSGDVTEIDIGTCPDGYTMQLLYGQIGRSELHLEGEELCGGTAHHSCIEFNGTLTCNMAWREHHVINIGCSRGSERCKGADGSSVPWGVCDETQCTPSGTSVLIARDFDCEAVGDRAMCAATAEPNPPQAAPSSPPVQPPSLPPSTPAPALDDPGGMVTPPPPPNTSTMPPAIDIATTSSTPPPDLPSGTSIMGTGKLLQCFLIAVTMVVAAF